MIVARIVKIDTKMVMIVTRVVRIVSKMIVRIRQG